MTTRYQTPSRARLPAGVASLLLPAAVIWMLSGQGGVVARQAGEALKTFTVAPEPPPPPPVSAPRPRRATPRKEAAAAPPALRARPKEIVAPKPQVLLPPPSIAAPTIASTGAQARAGAAPVPGPGTGAGGVGEGLGSGGSGDGDGGGGGTPYQQITRVRDGDWPEGADAEGAEGVVGVRFVIGVKGRLTSCAVTRSSGNAALDRGTCPILVKRLRFRPERDASGRPVPATVNGTQEWFER